MVPACVPSPVNCQLKGGWQSHMPLEVGASAQLLLPTQTYPYSPTRQRSRMGHLAGTAKPSCPDPLNPLPTVPASPPHASTESHKVGSLTPADVHSRDISMPVQSPAPFIAHAQHPGRQQHKQYYAAQAQAACSQTKAHQPQRRRGCCSPVTCLFPASTVYVASEIFVKHTT